MGVASLLPPKASPTVACDVGLEPPLVRLHRPFRPARASHRGWGMSTVIQLSHSFAKDELVVNGWTLMYGSLAHL